MSLKTLLKKPKYYSFLYKKSYNEKSSLLQSNAYFMLKEAVPFARKYLFFIHIDVSTALKQQ